MNILEKWEPVVSSLIDISDENKLKVMCNYAEQHVNPQTLSISLMILSKLLEEFKPAHVSIVNKNLTEKHEISLSLSREKIHDLKNYGIDVNSHLDSILRNEILYQYKKDLEKTGFIKIYQIVENASMTIAESTFAPRLIISSWYKPYDLIDERKRKMKTIQF